MKKSDLYRERARTMDMCEGTEVSAHECVIFISEIPETGGIKLKSVFTKNPDFDAHDIFYGYRFAVAILEGKPVFVGDKLYVHRDPYAVYANANCGASNERGHYPFQMCSWNPPKKTFEINGVEFPCPMGESTKMKVITEEDVISFFKTIDNDNFNSIEIFIMLKSRLQEIDTLTVSKLRPMCDAPKNGEIIQVVYSEVFEDAWWSGLYGRWQIEGECFYKQEVLKGWVPKTIYKPEISVDKSNTVV